MEGRNRIGRVTGSMGVELLLYKVLRCWVEVVEEDGGGFICTWDGGCAHGAMDWE